MHICCPRSFRAYPTDLWTTALISTF